MMSGKVLKVMEKGHDSQVREIDVGREGNRGGRDQLTAQKCKREERVRRKADKRNREPRCS